MAFLSCFTKTACVPRQFPLENYIVTLPSRRRDLEVLRTNPNRGNCMEVLAQTFSAINSFIWSWPLIILLVGTHLYMTFRLKFIQLHLFKGIKLSFACDDNAPGELNNFAALCLTLGVTVGTGNLAGVSTAIALGGPGAVFWMWIIGFFGIATRYAESLLALKYRVYTEDGGVAGGPMYVLEYGLGQKWLGILFAIFCALAAIGTGCMAQSHAVADLLTNQLGISKFVCGSVLAILLAIVSAFSIRGLAAFSVFLVPIMLLFYIVSCLVVLVMTIDLIPSTIALICTSAFTGQAAVGAFAGVTIREALRYGAARGLFSNEAGMGSAPIAAASAQSKNCVRQALVSSTAVFWDTIVICALTGIVVINSGVWNQGMNGTTLFNAAFTTLLPGKLAVMVIVVSITTFCFSTMYGWIYYTQKVVEYLVGQIGVFPYRCLCLVSVFFGALFSIDVVWDLADLFNALMVLPNLAAVLLLCKVVVDETDQYLWSGDIDADSEEQLPIYDTRIGLLTPPKAP